MSADGPGKVKLSTLAQVPRTLAFPACRYRDGGRHSAPLRGGSNRVGGGRPQPAAVQARSRIMKRSWVLGGLVLGLLSAGTAARADTVFVSELNGANERP